MICHCRHHLFHLFLCIHLDLPYRTTHLVVGIAATLAIPLSHHQPTSSHSNRFLGVPSPVHYLRSSHRFHRGSNLNLVTTSVGPQRLFSPGAIYSRLLGCSLSDSLLPFPSSWRVASHYPFTDTSTSQFSLSGINYVSWVLSSNMSFAVPFGYHTTCLVIIKLD